MRSGVSRDSIGILIVDDHAVVCSALRALIEKHPNRIVVGEAGNAADAVALAAKEQPEIILLDLCLGDENGVDLIPDLLKASSESRIILLTAVQDEDEFRRAVRQGALGVVGKGAPAEMLIKAIDRVNAGELWLNRQMTATVVTELRRAKSPPGRVIEPEPAARLTGREREVITLIGEGLKNKQIADRLCISETTVRHHLTSILKKLDLSDRVELLIFAYRHNMVTVQR